MRYSLLLFDLDHTLFDSAASERAAFRAAMDAVGETDESCSHFAVYDSINRSLWAALERDEIGAEEIRYERFRRFVDVVSLGANPIDMADAFVAGLGEHGSLVPGAREALESLRRVATLALVTNGIGVVQRARMKRLGLDAYFPTVAISGELGYSKPGVEIFHWVLGQLDAPAKEATLMIGDSLTSDMQGGFNFGVDTCWYNPSRLPAPDTGIVTHDVAELPQIVDLVAA